MVRILLKSSLRLPQTRAPYQTYQDQERIIASPSCLGEGSLYVGGHRQTGDSKRASYGQEETAAGTTCTPQGHPITSFTLIKNSINSTVRVAHVAWTPTSLPNSIVLLGGWDGAAEFTAEIVPGFEKWSNFHIFPVAGGGTFELRHSGY